MQAAELQGLALELGDPFQAPAGALHEELTHPRNDEEALTHYRTGKTTQPARYSNANFTFLIITLYLIRKTMRTMPRVASTVHDHPTGPLYLRSGRSYDSPIQRFDTHASAGVMRNAPMMRRMGMLD